MGESQFEISGGSMKSIVRIATVIVIGVALLFQNCSEMGGPGIGGIINFPSCAEGEECEPTVNGNPILLKLNIESGENIGGTKVQDVGLLSPSLEISGSCNSGGYRNTMINWKLLDGTTIVRQGRANGCSESANFTTSITIQGTPTLTEKTYKLEAELVGLDGFDNEFRGPGSVSRLDVRALDLKAAPFLDTRACPVNVIANGNWSDIKTNTFYIYNTNATQVFVGEDRTPALCGYCQVRGSLNTVTLTLERVGQVPGSVPLVFPPGGFATNCQLRNGNNPPAPNTPNDSGTIYNGYFVIPAFRVDDSSTVSGWHTRVLLSSQDDSGGTLTDVTNRNRQNIEIHFRLRKNGTMRGWTYPFARSVLKRLTSALTFQNVTDNNTLQVLAEDLMNAGSAVANTTALTLRRLLVVKTMNHTEASTVAGGPIVLKVADHQQPGTFAETLFQIAGRRRKCDPSITAAMDLPFVPNFNGGYEGVSGGTHSDINSRYAQLDRVAVCLTYWAYQGVLARNDGNLKEGLEKGISFEKAENRCKIVGTSRYIPNDVCGFMMIDASGGENTLNSLNLKVYNKFASNLHIGNTGEPATQMNKYYGAIAQRYLNWVTGDICQFPPTSASPGYEFWHKAINGALFSNLNKTAPYDSVSISSLSINEQNGFAGGNFKTFSDNDECMSRNASGSTDLAP
jgi:hypothetical protein